MSRHILWWLSHGVTASGAHHWPVSLIVVFGCVFAALFLAGVLVVGALRPDDRSRRLADRIERYGPRHRPQRADRALARIAGRWVAPVLKLFDIETGLAVRLDLASIARSPGEWVMAGGVLSVVLAFVLTALFGSPVIGAVVAVLAGWLAMHASLNLRIARRRAKFADQLPDILQFLAGSLRSGFSLPQGIDAAVRENTQPVSGEFSRTLAESRIGVEIEDALDQVADRMQSADLRWTVVAIRIQREVGGNLAEVLGDTVDTMRERAQLRRHVRALSAEGRLSAYILIALPIFVGGWLFLTRRSYVRVLWTTTPGIVMLVFAVVTLVVGAVWMRKLVTVEVWMQATAMLEWGLGAIGLAIALLVVAVAPARSKQEGIAGAAAVIEQRFAHRRPGDEDATLPPPGWLRGLGLRLSPAGQAASLQRRLDAAGNPRRWDADRLLAAKAVGLLALGGLGALYCLRSTVLGVPAAVIGGVAGFYLPDLLLYNTAIKRQALIKRALPDAMDMLTVCVEAGLGFDAAMARVARNTEGAVAGEFSRVLQEIQIGKSRTQALRAMADRTTVAELRSFVSAMVQAGELGIPIAEVMRTQSAEMRLRRRQWAEEKAQQVPVKILFPLILCLFPALFVIVIGPGAISIMHSLFGGHA